jgi:outer membrane lipoprotein-sorting protein
MTVMFTSSFLVIRKLILFVSTLLISVSFLPAQDATEIVRKADNRLNGEKSSISTMTMTIIRPTWERTVSFRNWTKGDDYVLTLITEPAREKGQTFLKRGNEMWSWNPSIERLIKLPPSMMSQGWMGSDYTNDDILKESSIVEDYIHTLEGEEEVDGHVCYRIRMKAKENAAVVWGSQIRWIEKNNYVFIRAELYDEEDYLVRTESGSDLKEMDGRIIPTRLEIIPEEEEGYMTVITIESIEFNRPVDDGFFSQQNMRRVR